MDRANHITQRLIWALGLPVVFGLLASVAGAAITIEMVTVGDPGNVGELSGEGSEGGGYGPPRVCGAVPYVYQIGKYEVTNAQYRAFLNSVARYGDPYALCAGGYNKQGQWVTPEFSGIERSGTGTVGDPYVYTAKGGDPNWDAKPVNYVSWYSSLRFINWLQNGQPVVEAGPGVTETGTYAFSDPSTVSIPDHSGLTTPHYALPTEDEWYKAAYYKGGGTAAGYWDYATQSDTLPSNNPPELDTGNSANYIFADDDPNTPAYAVGPPYYMTDAGAYGLSEGAYGTYDQNGNVFELLETPTPYLDGEQGLRGGSWAYGEIALPAFTRAGGVGQDVRVLDLGFRLALVPEPSIFVLLVAGAIPWIASRRER